jgi:hypothetical protein
MSESEAGDNAPRAEESCVRKTLRVLTLDMLNPEAPFLTFLRKLVLTTMAALSVVAFMFFARRVLDVARGVIAPAAWLYISFFYSNVLVWTYLLPYLYAVRHPDKVSGFLLSIQFFGGALSGLLIMVINPSWPLALAASILSILAGICNMPGTFVFFAMAFVCYIVSTYNYAALVTGATPIAMQDYPVLTFSGVFLNGLSGLALVAVTIVAVMLQSRHNIKMLTAAHAAADLSRLAAELLRSYDTDGVSRLLEEYGQMQDADPELIASYTALVDNLNQYRPHLPNWMINTGEEANTPRTQKSDQSMRSAMSRRSAQSTSVPSLSGSQSGSARGQSAVGGNLPRSTELTRSNIDPNAHGLQQAPAVANVAFATVAYRLAPAVAASLTQRAAAVNQFVDAMHTIATATHCALHSFVGDTVQLSWNAAMRAAQPENKAARFLARLQVAMAPADQLMSVHGAAMSGKATTQFAGTGRAQALTVSMPWHAAAQSLMTFAGQFGIMAMDGATATTANDVCDSRAVEVLAFSAEQSVGNSPVGRVMVHQILNERDEDNDEWMYVVDRNNRGGDAVTAALHLCEAQRYGEAIAALDKPAQESEGAEGEALATMFAARLRERAERAMLQRPDTFALSACLHCATSVPDVQR